MTTAPIRRTMALNAPIAFPIDATLWVLLGGLVAFDALAAQSLGWIVEWRSGWPLAWGVVCLLGISLYYRLTGRGEELARLAETMAVGIALPTACQVATFVLGTVGRPFQDAALLRADAWFGFRWETWVAWLATHPWLQLALFTVYATHLLQTGLVLGYLALRTERQATRLLRAFMIMFAVACVGLVLFPALGHILQADAVPVRLALRDGSFHTLDFSRMPGIISMPSMHAALAVLLSLAAWPVRPSRWLLTPVTAVMLVATLSGGGHYLVDVLTGVMLALISWRLVRNA